MEYHLDYLNERGFKFVTIVVGYLKDRIINTIKTRYNNLDINYVVSDEYATTGHGWSIFLTRKAWEKYNRPVILLHSDIFYDPTILDKVLESNYGDVVAVDENYKVITGDEVVVTGKNKVMSGFRWGVTRGAEDIAGEIIGINKWSAEFMEKFYVFMGEFFSQNGNNFNYEAILDQFIKEKKVVLHYIPSGGLPWVNINYPEDYFRANDTIFKHIFEK